MINEYSRYMRGGYPVPDLLKLYPGEFLPWYRIMEREIVEKHVIDTHDSKKAPLEGKALKRKVNAELEKRRKENNG